MALQNDPNQDYQLIFEQKPGYLFAKVTGDTDSLEISRQFWKEIATEVGRRQPKNLLVWEDFKTMVSTQELFTLVSEICEYQEFHHIRIAFVDEHFEQFNRNKLGEMIATNRGFCCRVCSGFDEAEQWILKG